MAIGVLQISDLHLKGDEKGLEQLGELVARASQSRCLALSSLLVLVSGDIAFSGKNCEYTAARRLLESLLAQLKKMGGPAILGPVIIPGNHDCDFSTEGDARPELLNSLGRRISSLDPQGQTVAQVTKVQSEFFAFERAYSETARVGAARLYQRHSLRCPDGEILVHCFNTAWVSREKEIQGQLLFPEYVGAPLPDTPPILAIATFHHPYAWLDSANARNFRRRVETLADIVFTGHEHDGDSFSRLSSTGASLEYIEGSALRPPNGKPGFNLVIIDQNARRYEIVPFEIDGDKCATLPSREQPFIRNPILAAHYFENSPQFRLELTELGGTFSHPIKSGLQISDLFVYPDFRARRMLDKKDSLVSSDNVLEFIKEQRCAHISGNALSGKTTLAKKIYLDLQDRNEYVPILLEGTGMRGNPKNMLPSAVDRAFCHQYAEEHLDRYRQLDRGRKALLIDDWHRVRFNSKGKADLLDSAKKHFDIVVTLGTDATWMQEVLEAGKAEQISGFWHCEIKEFGCRLRGRLITKWHTLGREFELDEGETAHLISTSENTLDNIIGKGIVPSDPFFILYALQLTGRNETTVTHGSFGHVYEALITARLAKSSSKQSEIGIKYTYLSLVAHKMFTSQKQYLSPNEIREVHEAFQRGFDISRDREKILGELEDARILTRRGEEIGFLHKYCYYYFVARYLHKALANEGDGAKVSKLLRDMADKVHDEEFMNILIFYIYLTEDRRLIEHILTNARSIFDEHEPCNLSSDVHFIQKLWKPRTIEIDDKTVDANREEYRSRKDEATDTVAQEETVPERTRYDRSLPPILKAEFAFKTLQVMGQVLRNFPGELRADLKLELTTESYRLGLRTLKAFLLSVEQSADDMRENIENTLQIYHARPAPETRERAAKIIAFMAEIAIYGMIKKISYSVGLEDLRETYEAVKRKAGHLHIPTRLIDLSIHLDHFPQIPMSDIEELSKIPAHEIVPHTILRFLVADYLYLFPVNYKDRQRLTSLLGFKDKRHMLSDKKLKPTTVEPE